MEPVARCSLFFDVQVLTLLSEKYFLFAHANLCYPTTMLRSYFSTIFAAHLCVYTRMMGCKRNVHPGYSEKSPNLQGTLKLHLQFYDRSQGCTDTAMKIDMHIFSVCTQYSYKCSVVGSPHLLTLFARTVRHAHVYVACI